MTKSFHTCENCDGRTEINTVLFRLVNTIDHSKGDHYHDSNYTWINVSAHETEADLIDTIVHESIHVAMKREDINTDAEHHLIKVMNWANEDWL